MPSSTSISSDASISTAATPSSAAGGRQVEAALLQAVAAAVPVEGFHDRPPPIEEQEDVARQWAAADVLADGTGEPAGPACRPAAARHGSARSVATSALHLRERLDQAHQLRRVEPGSNADLHPGRELHLERRGRRRDLTPSGRPRHDGARRACTTEQRRGAPAPESTVILSRVK